MEQQTVDQDDGDSTGKKSQATLLVELASPIELIHDQAGEADGSILIEGHRETWPINGRTFRNWLRRAFYIEHGKAPGAQAITDALGVLTGQAMFGSPEVEVHTRIAEYEDAIYLDLGTTDWSAVEIKNGKWKITRIPPVRFWRPRGLCPLPIPKRGGTLDELWKFINVTEEDKPLVLAWLVQALNPRGPYPALCIHGIQGAAKSTTARVLRQLVDPNTALLRAEPRNVQDLAICAKNNWVVSFDNISFLGTALSDALCRLSTGGGFATRELFTDSEEAIFDYQRPVILNGIEELANRTDLLERAIVLDLPPISKNDRKTEGEFWPAFEKAQPKLLGALLNAVAAAQQNLPHTELEEKLRMADFATWAVASEPAWGNTGGDFLTTYMANQETAQELPLEASAIAEPFLRFIRRLHGTPKSWSGQASQLLRELESVAGEKAQRRKTWPASAQSLSSKLRRLVTNFAAQGIIIEFMHSGKRWTTITTTPDYAPPGLLPSQVQEGLQDTEEDENDDNDEGDLDCEDPETKET